MLGDFNAPSFPANVVNSFASFINISQHNCALNIKNRLLDLVFSNVVTYIDEFSFHLVQVHKHVHHWRFALDIHMRMKLTFNLIVKKLDIFLGETTIYCYTIYS